MKPASMPMVVNSRLSRTAPRSARAAVTSLLARGAPLWLSGVISAPIVVLARDTKAPPEWGLRRSSLGAGSSAGPGLPLVPLGEAGVEGRLHQSQGIGLGDAAHVGDLADDEVLGALEHLLLAERQALALAHQPQVLEH